MGAQRRVEQYHESEPLNEPETGFFTPLASSRDLPRIGGEVGCSLLPARWMGIKENVGGLTNVGGYRSLAACTRDVEKVGGFCGKDCKDHRRGSISDCNPLLRIPKN
jgi:hypothetical protein